MTNRDNIRFRSNKIVYNYTNKYVIEKDLNYIDLRFIKYSNNIIYSF